MIKNFMKKNLIKSIFLILICFLVLFFYGWKIIQNNYDNQDKIIIFLKKIIPQKVAKKLKDTVFIIPNLKRENLDLSLQVKKYEQGLQGQLIEQKKIDFFDKKLMFGNYFLPFHRLDLRAGYESLNSTYRAHYLEVIDNNIFAISGEGQIIYFDKKNFFKDKLFQKKISSNLLEVISESNKAFFGVRDLFYFQNKIYLSIIVKNEKGYSFDIYFADLNLDNLNFKLFFETNSYFEKWSVSSGGRIEKFKDNHILVSLGYARVKNSPQNKNTLLGKIFSIDLNTRKVELISMGHRNPQGLIYLKDRDLIINTEHGPKGGDEINFNYVKKDKVPNYGFDVVSYGIEYDGTDPYKRPHENYGFKEPFKYFKTAIGISEAVFVEKKNNFLSKNILIVSSLRAGSLYIIELDDELKKITREQRISFGKERIRDLKFDEENKMLLLMFEMTPSIGVIKIGN